MVVDDHPVVVDGLISALEKSGEFKVVGQARDGVEAVRTALQVQPDVIVMDVLMPNMDGIAACREIMSAIPATRVIMLTASTDEEGVIEAMAAGAMGYLQKVSGRDHLLDSIQGVNAGQLRVPAEVLLRTIADLRGDANYGGGASDFQTHTKRVGDTVGLLAGNLVCRNSRGSRSQDSDHSERDLWNSGEVGGVEQPGAGDLVDAERTA